MIFGGFHLKQTFELAFCCAASFAHARPTFISADPCTFRNPVPVGSVLYLTATIAYTDPPLVSNFSITCSLDFLVGGGVERGRRVLGYFHGSACPRIPGI